MDLEAAAVEAAKVIVPEVYRDLAKPAVSEVGSVAGRSVKVLLFPLRGFLWGWEKIEELLVTEVSKKIEQIPVDRQKQPDPEIAVPLMQALSYTAQNETLREMYVNLLANSMDQAKENIVHPSFVEIIKNMNALDVKVFHRLAATTHYQVVFNPQIALVGQGKTLVNVVPEWYIGWVVDGFNEFDVSASIVRLSKFGLIELMFDRTAGGKDCSGLKNTPFMQNILKQCCDVNPDYSLEIQGTSSLLYLNEYGAQFHRACTG